MALVMDIKPGGLADNKAHIFGDLSELSASASKVFDMASKRLANSSSTIPVSDSEIVSAIRRNAA
jgi:hypothetical protein